MPSISCPPFFAAVTSASATGLLTVASTADVYPGSNAWVYTDNGASRARVKILAVPSATTIQVRRYTNDDENAPPSYGYSNMTTFNGSSHISVEGGQPVPVDPAFSKRQLP